MKNSRLFEILYILMEHRETTAGALAERLEVSVRTIYRDVDTLSAAGIPVYTEKGHGGGIRLMEQFQLDRTLLGEDEQEHIMTALQSLDAVGRGIAADCSLSLPDYSADRPWTGWKWILRPGERESRRRSILNSVSPPFCTAGC